MSVKEQLINDIELLPDDTLQVISIIVKKFIVLSDKTADKNEKNLIDDRKAMFGCLRGKYNISDDFDAPLEDMREYME